MRTYIFLSITAEDIALGVRGDPLRCAAVLALKRAVSEQEPALGLAGLGYALEDTPPDLLRWMLDFDAGRPVQPVTFNLETAKFRRINPGRPTDKALP